VSHDETSKGYTAGTAADVLFASNATCILVPETIIGPYYVAGESFRKNLADGEKGVATHFEIQFVDIKTCEAIPDLIVDLWHANALGVYSAVTAAGQGGLKTNWGRGSQQTDKDGVVQFESIFPGHYVGRTNHFHIMTTDNARILPNKTFEGGTVSHIGQVYFDEALIAEVEKKDPYVQNQQPVTNNREDELTGDEASEDYDPFMKYVKLGDDVEDGLLLWIGVGIDQTANYDGQVSVASHWHPDGGADKSDAEGQQSGASSVLHGYGTLLHLLGGLLSLYTLAC
jgi:protocatechuate 3,4-dioxygenase beta subunit